MKSSISLLARLVAWALPTLVASCSALTAQTFSGDFDRVLSPGGTPLRVGPYAGATYSIHDGRFVTTERNIVCCEFNRGQGFGPAAGMRMMVSVGESFFIAPAVGIESRGGTFESTPERLPIFGRGNDVETLTFQSTLEASLTTINAQVLGGYRFGESGVYVAAGPAASILLSQHYRKSERIVEPAGVRYLDGSTEKVLFDGEMDLVRSTMLSARAGVGATLPIADGISINPELLYSLPIGAASESDEWSIAGAHATVGVLFDL